MRRTTSTWPGSPEWLAQASATCSSSSGRHPARSNASACNGFSELRENTAASTSPTCMTTSPSADSTTTLPRCLLSTNPLRTASATTGSSSLILECDVARRMTHCERRRTSHSTGEELVHVGFALAVAAGDLLCARVHHALHLLALVGDVLLLALERLDHAAQRCVVVCGRVGQVDVGDELLDMAAVGVGARRLDGDVPAQAARCRCGRLVGEDVRQRLDQSLGRLAVAA